MRVGMIGRGGGGSSKVATAGNTPMLSSCTVYLILMYVDLISGNVPMLICMNTDHGTLYLFLMACAIQ